MLSVDLDLACYRVILSQACLPGGGGSFPRVLTCNEAVLERVR